MSDNRSFDVIIIGAGPAGLTAGIYLSRAKFNTLIVDSGTVGGQMVLTHEIANYPGVESMSGYQLGMIMRKQAQNFGCTIKANTAVTSMQLEGDTKEIVLEDGSVYSAKAVILATGGRPRTLGVKGEAEFKGQGISYCATCDGDFFTGKEIVVVGGGNSALEEAVSLTKYASKVTLVHQFDHFQAFPHAIDEVKNNPKVDIVLESVIDEFYGEGKLGGVVIRNLKTGEKYNFPTDGVFIFIGYAPNTEAFETKIGLNNRNEIIVDQDMATNIQGVYAAGDCIVKKYRQVTSSVADGTIAALASAAYISQKK